MTDIDRAALRRLCEAAVIAAGAVRDGPYSVALVDAKGTVIADFLNNQGGAANTAFYIDARKLLPALLDSLEAAEARVQALEDELDMYRKDADREWYKGT